MKKTRRVSSAASWLKARYKVIIVVLLAIVLGFVGEILYNMPVLLQGERTMQEIELGELQIKGFEYRDDILTASPPEENELEANPSITLKLDGGYIGKLRYTYQTAEELNVSVDVTVKDEYNNNKIVTIEDKNNVIYNESIVNIRKKTDEITIYFQEWVGDLQISQIFLDNTFHFSRVRFLFTCLAACFIMFVILAKEIMAKKIEWAFLGVSLFMGMVLILALPLHKINLDEEIHFSRAYHLSSSMTFSNTIANGPVLDLMRVSKANWPFSNPGSEEEHKQEWAYLNTHGVYKGNLDSNLEVESDDYGIYTIGYISQAFMIVLGKVLGLPVGYIYVLGRLGNLLMYSLVIFAAIRNIKAGKRILTVISLLPTPIFQACVYGYDATVYAFIMLGLSYIINEFVERDRKISYKGLLIFTLAMLIGCAPKAVYIPLILLVVFLPKEKFKNKKEKYLIKGIGLLLCLLMMATFVLPASGGDVAGDLRGGNTSISGQLSLIFSQPLGYTKVLLRNIKDTFGSYVFGLGAVGGMGHAGTLQFPLLTTLLLGAVALTDRPENEKLRLTWFQKVVTGVLVFGTISLIWTALYLSYTPVGETAIQGVQGRYYLPLLLPIFLIMNTAKIRIECSPRVYNMAMMCVGCFLTLHAMYTTFIVNCF